MKKIIYSIFIFICLFGFISGLNAQDIQRQYTITWEDNNVKSEGFQWNIFMSDQSGVYNADTPILTVSIADAIVEDTGYKTIGSINITGLPGSTVKKYFVMQSQLGTRKSIFSNEAMVEFPIPLTAPYGVKVIFNIIGE